MTSSHVPVASGGHRTDVCMHEVLGINVEPKSIVGGLYEKALLGFKKRSGVSTGNNRCSPKNKNDDDD